MMARTPGKLMAATAYSSIVGVPLVTSEGRRVANTAIPGMPIQLDHLKTQAVIDAAFIANAWNCFDDLWNALEQCRSPIAALASIGSEQCKSLLPQIDATLAAAKRRGCPDCDYGVCTMNCGPSSGDRA